ncbi:MAG: iron-containing alcohol dehydrogenase [Desulfitobacteriaceae bacterium]
MTTLETVLPQKIISGDGSLEYLKTLKGERAFVIVSGAFAKTNPESMAQIKKYLDNAGLAYEIVYSQGQEPSLDYVKESAKLLQDFSPDYIIAVGGGSTLDSAKIMKVLYEFPDISNELLFKRFSLPPMQGKTSLIAIPTTSGTGSEVTPYNVVYVKTDNLDIPFIKTTVADYQTMPDVVLLEPTFTVSMSPDVTANTGMDALVHAIEAYISKKPKNAFSDMYALEAIKIILEYLPKAYSNGTDIEARAKMQYAATMAGIAIANRGTGLAHGTGQQLGPAFGVRHGLSVSIVLEPVLEFNYEVCTKEYLQIADYLGIKEDNDEKKAKAFFDRVKELMQKIEFPTKVQQIGIEKEEYLEKIDIMAKNALENGATLTNPKMPTLDDAKQIFLLIS